MENNKTIETEYEKGNEKEEHEEAQGNYMSLGMCFGLALGGVFGLATNNSTTCMLLGMCLGLAVGSLVKKK
jgi:hypothetical protein